jgi:hypothetical protein
VWKTAISALLERLAQEDSQDAAAGKDGNWCCVDWVEKAKFVDWFKEEYLRSGV